VGTTCEVLELDLDTALTEVGKFAAPELIRFAKGMLHPEWKLLKSSPTWNLLFTARFV